MQSYLTDFGTNFGAGSSAIAAVMNEANQIEELKRVGRAAATALTRLGVPARFNIGGGANRGKRRKGSVKAQIQPDGSIALLRDSEISDDTEDDGATPGS